MTTYDEEILKEYAGKLYKQAYALILGYMFFGICTGAVIGFYLHSNRIISEDIFIFVPVVLLGAVGYYIGDAKAFELKFRAQLALCLAKIEENTRAL